MATDRDKPARRAHHHSRRHQHRPPPDPPSRPAPAGLLQPLGLAWPFLVAGTVKTLYDLTLWRIFRRVQLPTRGPS
ncbi:hypothetical protein ACIBQ1_54580 [Nonomuraea sp. NPDC050153]|uniref:hypothetical protein n=1 Tax=Nonomuraea sp. NPDC050153 TaxID=3364359 RepID=UPI003799350C